jgi:hypothetical protein
VLAAAAALLAAFAAAVIALVLATGSPAQPSGPLRAGEITGAVRSFAGAYDQRNSRALARILAPDVMELTPGAAERGRAAVLNDLKAQFGATTGYALGDVAVQPGWVGRATSQYAVLRTGRPDLSGQITFGIERVAGRPVIGLIVIQPAG